jgi:hypothetical protein
MTQSSSFQQVKYSPNGRFPVVDNQFPVVRKAGGLAALGLRFACP